ncbi:HAD-IA family hydrolase [Agaribacter marinus]|uniref:2-haloalkanoic acid dehalogenase n=1 Tax=Agaribacter marinus TaxID=1431249 RepID=A0AA37SW35_9ALTE|nr:HAD-IA family hydrolase [Agaribacter marinus]GLR69210.1 2-haloalkanoic acid dehalogenase [Agaribacter marinus]
MIIHKPLPKIEAISFDLDDTFYDNWPHIKAADQYLLDYISKHYPQAAHYTRQDWTLFKLKALQEQPELAHHVSVLREVTLTKAFVFAEMNAEDIPSAVSKCFDAFYDKRSDFMVSKGIRRLLRSLSYRLPLVAITNGNVDCKKIGIGKYFSHILLAGPDGRMKPSADMFNKASILLNIPPEKMLHVGDNLDKDIKGAIDAGYNTAWYAADRQMAISNERDARLLPHIQLKHLKELKRIIKKQR